MPRILFVEDEKSLHGLFPFIAQGVGCDYRVAASAEEALDLIQEEKPDIVVSDIRMPGMGGIELARRIREDPELSIVVVLTSGFSEQVQTMTSECDWFIPKPYKPNDMVELLEEVLGSREQ